MTVGKQSKFHEAVQLDNQIIFTVLDSEGKKAHPDNRSKKY